MTRSKRQKKRIRNPVQTRAKLLQATIDLVAEKGPDALSLKDAARAAHVSRGVAYQHFKSRDHLLQEARTWMSDRLMDSLVTLRDASTEERIAHVANLVLEHREASTLFIADALAGRVLKADHPLYRLLLEILEEFRLSGRARSDMDVEIMSFIMVGSVGTLIMLSQLRNGGDREELARRFTTEWSKVLQQGIFRKGSRHPLKSNSPRLGRRPHTRSRRA
jgi:AcrR family transcriptional regulator